MSSSIGPSALPSRTDAPRGVICLSALGGTIGDVRPLAALGLALRGRGFGILVVGDGSFERAAGRAGLSASEWFSYSQVPHTFQMRTTGGQRWLWGQHRRIRDRWLRRELAAHKQQRLEAFWRRVDRPGGPRIVAAVGSVSALAMLRRFGDCPRILSSPLPVQPSRHFSLAPPDLSWYRRLRLRWYMRRHAAERRAMWEGMFHLVSVSPAVFPRPDDWLPNMHVTGYMSLDDDHAGWQPPPALRRFMLAGTPPVYIGFGSYPFLFGPRGERLAREIVEGCRRAGVRAILHTSDLSPAFEAGDQVYILDGDVPFPWLFPRCAAIVHHGGYGTTHLALLARRPTVIYPFQADQFLWAARVGELGAGPGFRGRLSQLTADRLAADLAVALGGECRDRAERLGMAMEGEHGLATQVDAIESIVEHSAAGRGPLDWRMAEVAC